MNESTVAGSADLEATILTSEADFLNLREAWNALARDAGAHAIFLRHEWFEAANAWPLAGRRLRIICMHAGSDLVAVCPFVLITDHARPFDYRVLEFLTVPDTQFCDLLVHPSHRNNVLKALATVLMTRRKDWDILRLTHFAESSPTPAELKATLADHCNSTIRDYASNPHIELSGTWEEFYATRSRRLKKGNNLAANRLKKLGQIELRRLSSATYDDQRLENLLAEITTISSQSWKNTTGKSLENEGPQAFIETLTRSAFREGWLSVWILSVDSTPIAMEYQLVDQGRAYALRADFDAAYDAVSPGTYLNWKLLEQLFDEDLECYYMGPGENSYKFRWTEATTSLDELVAYNRTAKGLFRYIADEKLRPLAKKLLHYRRRPPSA